MTVYDVIRESEKEHAEPCAVNEWREARLNDREAVSLKQQLDGKSLRGWIASVVYVPPGTKFSLRYTRK